MFAKIASFSTNRNLSLVQILTSDQNSFDYTSGARAMRENWLEAKEINSAGSVNHLFVINHSDAFVFLMDGDILAGAKQNRVVNTSILLAPHTKTEIPVSCVEAGRWQFISEKFRGADYIAPSNLRGMKAEQVRASLKTGGAAMADQTRIWSEVASYHARHGVTSTTSSLSDVYEQKEGDFEGFVGSFHLTQGSNGVAVYFGKELLSLDIFNRTDIFAEVFPKLLRGIAAEVFSLRQKVHPLPEPEARFRTLDTLDRIDRADRERYPGVGVGEDLRYEAEGVSGFELKYGKHTIHLSGFGGKKKARKQRDTVAGR